MSNSGKIKIGHAVLRVVAIYALFGCLWIYGSGIVLEWFVHDPDVMTRIEIFKGFIFIVLTAALLYLLLYRFSRQLAASEQSTRESEERYRRLFEVETDAIFVLDRESHRFLDANPAAQEMYGYTLGEFLRLTSDDISEEPEKSRQAIATDYMQVPCRLHRKKDGTVFPVEIAGSYFECHGRAVHVAAIRDISERKRIEEELKSNKSRLEFALLASHMGVWEWDLQTNAVVWSPECHEIVGLKEFNGTFEVFAELLHPDDAAHVMDTVKRALVQRSNYADEFRIIRPDGELRWLSNLGQPTYDSNGIPLRLTGTVQDITARKQAEKELLDKNTELEHFTYTVSHDLKSPLITIQSYAGMIKQDLEAGLFTRITDDLQRIADASAKMGMLLDDLLQLSRIGRMMSPPSRVDMGCLVKDVLAQLAGPLKQKRVEVALLSDLPPVHGDQRRIAEVLQNLVENALKYMGDQESPRIGIGVREEGKKRVFFVSDNGAGIDLLHHQSIFGLFNKIDGSSEGTGIGLALVKRIVEVHGGEVWVESDGLGKGSTFCFTLAR